MDYREADLRGVDWTGASFVGEDFTLADFRGATLNNCTFENCNFYSADLAGASLAHASLVGSSMQNANLFNVSFPYLVADGLAFGSYRGAIASCMVWNSEKLYIACASGTHSWWKSQTPESLVEIPNSSSCFAPENASLVWESLQILYSLIEKETLASQRSLVARYQDTLNG